MAEEQTIGSILLADCGTVMTKVILLDQVNGQYRLVAQGEAPTTSEYPWGDVTEGIRHAIEQITEITGRTFLDGQGDIITPEQDARYGVDAFAATTSASPPLSVVLGGVTRDLSVASAERAVSGTYSHIKAILSAERREDAMSEEAFVRTIREARPDVICVAGGTDGGATVPVLNLVKSVAIACALMEEGIRPQVLYAGNVQLRQRIANLLKDRVTVRMADNVRPTLTEENLADAQAELNALYLQRKMSLLPGFDVLNSWVQLPIEPSATMFARLIRYLWHLGDPTRGVLGVDVGAANTTIVAVFNGRPYLTIQGGMGSAFGGKSLLRRRRGQPVVRWMPEDVDIEEAYGVLLNAEMRPATIQQDMRELRLAHSLARETLRAALAIARPGWQAGEAEIAPDLLPLCDTILVSGNVLTRAPWPGQTALILLDALEPVGITTMVLDMYGVSSVLGSVAAIKPLAAVGALDNGALVNLATVIAPIGRARRGDVALRVRVTYDDGGTLEIESHYGEIDMVSLLPGREAELEIRPTRRFDVGFGGPGKKGKRRVSGGLAGLIVDARGRPLRLPRDAGRRQMQLRRWLWDVGS